MPEPPASQPDSARRARRRLSRSESARRRRRIALAAVAGASALAGLIVGAGAGGEPPAAPPAPISLCQRTAPASIARIAGQGVAVRMENRATPALISQARAGLIGAVIMFPSAGVSTDRLKAEISKLQAAARAGGRPRLLVMIDQEGGPVERLPDLPPQLSPYTLAQNDDRAASKLEGQATGYQLRALGINVDLAPVLDVPESPDQFMFSRSFGLSPGKVSRLGLAFARGLEHEGVLAAPKHFPGLGRAPENTDYAPTTISASRSKLIADAAPFKVAATTGTRMIMVSLASYPALGSPRPAALAAPVVDLLRGDLGFGGAIVSDDLLAPAINGERSAPAAAIAATAAGVDLKLYALKPVDGIAAALARAAASGRLDPLALRSACEHVLDVKRYLAERPRRRRS